MMRRGRQRCECCGDRGCAKHYVGAKHSEADASRGDKPLLRMLCPYTSATQLNRFPEHVVYFLIGCGWISSTLVPLRAEKEVGDAASLRSAPCSCGDRGSVCDHVRGVLRPGHIRAQASDAANPPSATWPQKPGITPWASGRDWPAETSANTA